MTLTSCGTERPMERAPWTTPSAMMSEPHTMPVHSWAMRLRAAAAPPS